MEFLVQFWSEQRGQDLVEYTLLIAFFAAIGLALVWGAQPSISSIWNMNTNNIRTADRVVGP